MDWKIIIEKSHNPLKTSKTNIFRRSSFKMLLYLCKVRKASYLLASDWWKYQTRNVAYCLFSREIHRYDPTRKQTVCTASQKSLYQGDGSPLHIASSERLRESRSPDAALRLHLMLREGAQGESGGRIKIWKGLFFTCDKSCSFMGGTRPSDLTKGWTEWSQWPVHLGNVLVGQYSSRRRRRRRRRRRAFSQWDCEGISSAALHNRFLGVSSLSHVSLNICSTLSLHAKWAKPLDGASLVQILPNSACTTWHKCIDL